MCLSTKKQATAWNHDNHGRKPSHLTLEFVLGHEALARQLVLVLLHAGANLGALLLQLPLLLVAHLLALL